MIHKIVVSQFTKMLGNLSAILDKAAAFAEPKKIDMDVLLNARLAPDQFNLLRQIQIACDTANLGAARLTGKEATTPSFPDSEKTLAEIKARIASTIEILRKLSEADFADSATRRISQPRWEGKTLSGEEFRTSISTSPPPTRSCAITGSMSARRIISAPCLTAPRKVEEVGFAARTTSSPGPLDSRMTRG